VVRLFAICMTWNSLLTVGSAIGDEIHGILGKVFRYISLLFAVLLL
jgi:hypothetical protein